MTSITVCVPVYDAAAFVRETLDHIAAQTFRDFKVLVSVDECSDDSELVCRRMESDSRFEVVTQTRRLGWVGNVNWLIGQVDTPFFCITPHDDLLDPHYLQATRDLLMREPAAACAYSDIQGFGEQEPVISQPEVRGDRMQRVLDALLNHYSAVTFRGLIRRRNTEDRPLVPTGIPRDFAADTAWTVRLALRGELLRIPALLYRKRYDDSSVHAGWGALPRREHLQLQAGMVAVCTRTALEETSDPVEREEILTAGLLRASGYSRSGGWGVPMQPLEIARSVAEYALATRDLGALPDLDVVLGRTRVAALQNALAIHASCRDVAPPLRTRVLRKARKLMGL
ncbi:MAG: glycosyltransferase family A protein [Gemmatimonas sp.]